MLVWSDLTVASHHRANSSLYAATCTSFCSPYIPHTTSITTATSFCNPCIAYHCMYAPFNASNYHIPWLVSLYFLSIAETSSVQCDCPVSLGLSVAHEHLNNSVTVTNIYHTAVTRHFHQSSPLEFHQNLSHEKPSS